MSASFASPQELEKQVRNDAGAHVPTLADNISAIYEELGNSIPTVDAVANTLKYRGVPLRDYPEEKLSKGRKVAISTFLILCNSTLMMSFGAGMSGAFDIGKSFGVFDPTTAAWIAASYPLTQGAFVLISGRLGAVYGHKNVLFLGGAWWILWSMINGFCTGSLVTFAVARAFSGIGAAFVTPNVVAIIGITFPPGKMRNLSFGFFGFGAPVGGTIGAIIIGMFIKWVEWRWFFFFLAIFGTLLFAVLAFVLPPETAIDKGGNVDWFGSFLGLSGLVIFNFVWNQAPAVGWSNVYEIALLPVSICCFVSFVLWEHKFAREPIMPLDIWAAPSFFPLILVVSFSVMSYGISLWYMIAWQQLVRQWGPLRFAIGLIPHAVFGGLAAPIAAWLIPKIAAQWILAFGAIVVLLSSILLVTMPPQQTYRVQIFPATILMSLCPDFIFTAAQIIATNSVRRHEQGIAGSLISLLQLYGASTGLGFAGTIEAQTRDGDKPIQGYRGALYFAIGLAIAALVIDIAFVRVPKDEREGWAEEQNTEPEAEAEKGVTTDTR